MQTMQTDVLLPQTTTVLQLKYFSSLCYLRDVSRSLGIVDFLPHFLSRESFCQVDWADEILYLWH